MKGTQTVFAGQSRIWRLRGAVQGYAKPDFDLPSRDADVVDHEAQKFLALGEIQSMYGGPDPMGKAFDAVPQPVLLRQFLTLIKQGLPLRIEGAAPQFQLVAAAQKLFPLYETRLVEIGQAPALSGDGVELVVEPGKLGGEQLVASCLASR